MTLKKLLTVQYLCGAEKVIGCVWTTKMKNLGRKWRFGRWQPQWLHTSDVFRSSHQVTHSSCDACASHPSMQSLQCISYDNTQKTLSANIFRSLFLRLSQPSIIPPSISDPLTPILFLPQQLCNDTPVHLTSSQHQ